MFNRRSLLLTAPALAMASRSDAATPDFAALERASGGKLGLFVLDTGTGRTLAWRADARFPFCSSFKLMLGGWALYQADHGRLSLDERVRFGPADMLSYAPVAAKHLSQGFMTIRELCAAAMELSDNTAANLMLRRIGGPAALTAWAHSIGDRAFQLSHNETKLNYSRFGDALDTTTPVAMGRTVQRLALADVLRPASRAQFIAWMLANRTGDKRLRAGLPADWREGDRTGTFDEHWVSAVDVVLTWPPRHPPVIISAFVTEVHDFPTAERTFAEVGRQVARWVGDAGG